jgi:hypothetical protein
MNRTFILLEFCQLCIFFWKSALNTELKKAEIISRKFRRSSIASVYVFNFWKGTLHL